MAKESWEDLEDADEAEEDPHLPETLPGFSFGLCDFWVHSSILDLWAL